MSGTWLYWWVPIAQLSEALHAHANEDAFAPAGLCVVYAVRARTAERVGHLAKPFSMSPFHWARGWGASGGVGRLGLRPAPWTRPIAGVLRMR